MSEEVKTATFETEEGALKVKKLTPYEAAFMIIGVNIGSGILSLAYSGYVAGHRRCSGNGLHALCGRSCSAHQENTPTTRFGGTLLRKNWLCFNFYRGML